MYKIEHVPAKDNSAKATAQASAMIGIRSEIDGLRAEKGGEPGRGIERLWYDHTAVPTAEKAGFLNGA